MLKESVEFNELHECAFVSLFFFSKLARYTQNTNTTANKKSVVVLYVVVYVAQSTRALGAAALLYQKAL